jgi:hypothetical protein
MSEVDEHQHERRERSSVEQCTHHQQRFLHLSFMLVRRPTGVPSVRQINQNDQLKEEEDGTDGTRKMHPHGKEGIGLKKRTERNTRE